MTVQALCCRFWRLKWKKKNFVSSKDTTGSRSLGKGLVPYFHALKGSVIPCHVLSWDWKDSKCLLMAHGPPNGFLPL